MISCVWVQTPKRSEKETVFSSCLAFCAITQGKPTVYLIMMVVPSSSFLHVLQELYTVGWEDEILFQVTTPHTGNLSWIISEHREQWPQSASCKHGESSQVVCGQERPFVVPHGPFFLFLSFLFARHGVWSVHCGGLNGIGAHMCFWNPLLLGKRLCFLKCFLWREQ